MNYFKHCRDCTPPKRHPGCSGVCEDYKKDRERYDADMAKNPDKTPTSGYYAKRFSDTKDSMAKYKKKQLGKRNYGGDGN